MRAAFIDSLKNPQTIVIAAAAADRTSFGCSNDRDLTYFGEAFYRDALPERALVARCVRQGQSGHRRARAPRARRGLEAAGLFRRGNGSKTRLDEDCAHPDTLTLMNQPTHRTIEANGIRIHIAEQGSGPLVLLCHGFPESWYSWRHQLRALAQAGFHAVAPDMRGYGHTDRPAEIERYSLFHLVGDMVGRARCVREKEPP